MFKGSDLNLKFFFLENKYVDVKKSFVNVKLAHEHAAWIAFYDLKAS